MLVASRLGLGSAQAGPAPEQSTVEPLDLTPMTSQPSSYYRAKLELESTGYLYSPRTKSEDIYTAFIGRPDFHTQSGVFELGGLGVGIFMTPLSKRDQPNAYFELPEVYAGLSPESLEGSKLFAGRKLEEWNHLDDEWKLGIWQPRYRWDYLRPDPVALTGFTAEIRQPFFKAVVFGSPLFIPERGVPVSNENGQLISNSPWFISPPSRISVLTHDTPLNYDLQVPPTRDILFHPSFSSMVQIGDEQQGPWLSGGYAYKPMNQLLLAYDGYLLLDGGPQSQTIANVPVVPRVVYHHLVSLEAGIKQDEFSAWLSTLLDRPGKDESPPLGATFTQQTVTKSFAVSPTGQFKMIDDHGNLMKVDLSYLYQVGGNGPDQSSGPALLEGQSVFESRYPFQSALRMGGEIDVPEFLHTHGVTALSSSLLYDFGHRGSILTTDAKYRPSLRWEFGLGADVLGSQEPNAGTNGTSNDFIGRYQANDRVRTEVSYVF